MLSKKNFELNLKLLLTFDWICSEP